MSSQVADVKAQYPSSEEDLETMICLFVLNEISKWPKKKHWPTIYRSSGVYTTCPVYIWKTLQSDGRASWKE